MLSAALMNAINYTGGWQTLARRVYVGVGLFQSVLILLDANGRGLRVPNLAVERTHLVKTLVIRASFTNRPLFSSPSGVRGRARFVQPFQLGGPGPAVGKHKSYSTMH
jgi:hypothetical protein